MRNILVLRGGALGDFVVTLPALAALRQRWPQARIELVGNAAAASLARARGLLDCVRSQDEACWSALFSAPPLPSPLARWLAGFDLVLNYWPDPDGEVCRHFPARPGQIFLRADATPTSAPAAAHFCTPLTQLGITQPDCFHPLRPITPGAMPGATIRSESYPENPKCVDRRPAVALHPGSGSPRKNWPIHRWLELCAAFNSQSVAELLIITGEADRAAAAALAGSGRSAHQLPLESLIRELAGCRLFIGHDSGISHLAAACGVPSLLLFGPTDPAMWAPPAPHVRVLQRGAHLDSITVAEVMAAAGLPEAAAGP